MNHFVRRYPGSTDKCKLAQDKVIKLGNQLFTAFPIVQTLVGFVHQGDFVGLYAKNANVSMKCFII